MRTNPPPGPSAGGRTLLHGVGGRNPTLLLAGGGAAVVIVIALMRRGGSSATSATGTPVGAATYDSTLQDIQAQWENQFEALQNQIAQQNPAPAGAPAASAGTWPGRHAPTLGFNGPPMPDPKQGPPTSGATLIPLSQTQAIATVHAGNTMPSTAAFAQPSFPQRPTR